jgi:hypothetical protein
VNFKKHVIDNHVTGNIYEKQMTNKKDEEDSRFELNQLEFKDEFVFDKNNKYEF